MALKIAHFTERLCQAIAAAGHWVEQRDNVLVSSNDAAVQAIIDAYPLASAQQEVCDAIDAHARGIKDQKLARYSPYEMAAWPIKRAEAGAFQKSANAGDAPLLAAESARSGLPLAETVTRVIANAQAFEALEAHVSGIAAKHKALVRAAADYAAVVSYDWRGGWPA